MIGFLIVRYLFGIGSFILVIFTFFSLRQKKNNQNGSVRHIKVRTLQERQESEIEENLAKAKSYEEAGQKDMAVRTWRDVLKKYPQMPQTAQAVYFLMNFHIKNRQKNFVNLYFTKLKKDFESSKIFPQALYEYAQFLVSIQKLLPAKEYYQTLMDKYLFFPKRFEVEKKLEQLNMRLLYSPKIVNGTQHYTIENGDSLSSISKKFNTPIDFLVEVNHLTRNKVIHPGQVIKVLDPKTKISLLIDKSQKLMLFMFNKMVYDRFFVAIGSQNKTPIGNFFVQNKLKDPVWFRSGEAIPSDDPRNVLGSRWIGFDRDFGIHGTIDKKNILLQTSNGCIRMTNKEVEKIYGILRIGDPIVIID